MVGPRAAAFHGAFVISRPSDTRGRALLALFTAAVFVSATLLFLVQPLVGRMVLPRGGGSPQVWNTALVFFQVALLAGYLYAHASVRYLGVRLQAAVHVGVLLLPLLVLPIGLPEGPPPGEEASQALWILGLLGAAVGLPFVVLAAANPVLQRWLSTTEHEAADDPYFLYAASNAGSLVGLLAYPFVLEPLLPLSAQARVWAFGYGAFVVLAAGCAAVVLTRVRLGDRGPAAKAVPESGTTTAAGSGVARGAPTARDRLFWIAASAVPSALLIGVTQYLTSRIAPVPLLWVLPLAVYLTTFIVAFARRQPLTVSAVSRLLSVTALVLAILLLMRIVEPPWLIIPLHLLVLAAAGLLCHMRVVAGRPATTHLTEFYLLISLGGAVGGASAALAAPLLFDFVAEYPVAVVLACFFRVPIVAREPAGARRLLFEGRALDVMAPIALAVYVFGGERLAEAMGRVPDAAYLALLAIVPTLLCFFFSPRPARFALGVAVLLTFAQSGRAYRGNILLSERTFFGVYRVSQDPDSTVNILFHGATAHGVQSLAPELSGEPLAYYHRTGPAGRVLTAFAERDDKRDVALVGAGTGALAVFASPHQHVTLFEIDPIVVEIAEDPRFFTFLRDARATHETVVGDARITLARSERSFDLMVLDAFSSGSVPVHLMTREALELYLSRLRPGGVLLFHISNRHLDLQPVLARHVLDLGLLAFESIDVREESESGIFGSHWVMMARTPADLAYVAPDGWAPLRLSPDPPLWTDDFSNLLSVLRLR